MTARVPEPRTSLLPTILRERIIEEFRDGDPRVVKLIAPAGYGKTTLAASFSGAKPIMRCDCLHMSTPIDLLRGVLDGVANALPEAERPGIAGAVITLGDDAAAWLSYAQSLLHLDRSPGILLFDNGEALLDKPDVQRIIERMLEDVSPDLKVVFCARVEVPVNFARFAGPERTMRIGPDELRFDPVEMALLLSPIGANSSMIARVDTFTRGWPMLVMMLFVLAKRGRLDAYLSGTGPDVTDLYGYLATEVLASLEPWARDLLEVVVALPDARQSDLEALYGPETATRIADLQVATPFLSRTPRSTLEVHPAISEILQKASARGTELAHSIIDVLAPENPIRAARICVHLEEYERAADLLEGGRYWLRTPSLDLIEVLYLLPPEALIRHPAVWNVASYARVLTRDSAEWLRLTGFSTQCRRRRR